MSNDGEWSFVVFAYELCWQGLVDPHARPVVERDTWSFARLRGIDGRDVWLCLCAEMFVLLSRGTVAMPQVAAVWPPLRIDASADVASGRCSGRVVCPRLRRVSSGDGEPRTCVVG